MSCVRDSVANWLQAKTEAERKRSNHPGVGVLPQGKTEQRRTDCRRPCYGHVYAIQTVSLMLWWFTLRFPPFVVEVCRSPGVRLQVGHDTLYAC